MRLSLESGPKVRGRSTHALVAALATLTLAASGSASALPLYARQTGQNCAACHAGGQFPELTAYGRLFKLTAYATGERTIPISAMALASVSKVSNTTNSADPATDFPKNSKLLLATTSVFLGGKITDNIGAFAQITFDPYAEQRSDGSYAGHSQADNIDICWADHFSVKGSDLIFGVSANNNPSISDPWNTAPAWMQYVPVPSPGSSQFIDGAAPYPGYGAGGNLAGLTAYGFLDQRFYAEFGAYRTANGALRFMSAGAGEPTRLKGLNPYWRLAYNHTWGAHQLMVGTSGMNAAVYDDPASSDPSTLAHFNDRVIDAQYQYLADVHAVTLQFASARNRVRYSVDALANAAVEFVSASGAPLPPPNAEDVTRVLRLKATYVYRDTYGGSLGAFRHSGSTNAARQTAGYPPDGVGGVLPLVNNDGVTGNLSGNPGTRGRTSELFWTPIEYLRLGAQYTAYNRFNGAASNYNGTGRSARNNNTLFLYAWGAY
jgi:hypothetical protein